MIELLMGLDPAWLALIMSLVGGGFLKLIERHLGKRAANSEAPGIELRNDLREEVSRLRDDIKMAGISLERWKKKYWQLVEELSAMKYETNKLGEEIRTQEVSMSEAVRQVGESNRENQSQNE